MLSRHALAAAACPVLAHSPSFGGFLDAGAGGRHPSWTEGLGPLCPLGSLRGFAFSLFLWILAQRVGLIGKGTNASLFQYVGWSILVPCGLDWSESHGCLNAADFLEG